MSTPIPKDVSEFKEFIFKSMTEHILSDSTKVYSPSDVVKIIDNAAEMIVQYIENNGVYKIAAQDTENVLHIFNNQVFNFYELDDTIVLQYLSDDYTREALDDITVAAEALRNETGKYVLVLPSNYKALKARLQLDDL